MRTKLGFGHFFVVLFLSTFCFSSFAYAVTITASGYWPMNRANVARSSYSTKTGPGFTNVFSSTRVVLSSNTGKKFSSPVVDSWGRAYIAESGTSNNILYQYNPFAIGSTPSTVTKYFYAKQIISDPIIVKLTNVQDLQRLPENEEIIFIATKTDKGCKLNALRTASGNIFSNIPSLEADIKIDDSLVFEDQGLAKGAVNFQITEAKLIGPINNALYLTVTFSHDQVNSFMPISTRVFKIWFNDSSSTSPILYLQNYNYLNNSYFYGIDQTLHPNALNSPIIGDLIYSEGNGEDDIYMLENGARSLVLGFNSDLNDPGKTFYNILFPWDKTDAGNFTSNTGLAYSNNNTLTFFPYTKSKAYFGGVDGSGNYVVNKLNGYGGPSVTTLNRFGSVAAGQDRIDFSYLKSANTLYGVDLSSKNLIGIKDDAVETYAIGNVSATPTINYVGNSTFLYLTAGNYFYIYSLVSDNPAITSAPVFCSGTLLPGGTKRYSQPVLGMSKYIFIGDSDGGLTIIKPASGSWPKDFPNFGLSGGQSFFPPSITKWNGYETRSSKMGATLPKLDFSGLYAAGNSDYFSLITYKLDPTATYAPMQVLPTKVLFNTLQNPISTNISVSGLLDKTTINGDYYIFAGYPTDEVYNLRYSQLLYIDNVLPKVGAMLPLDIGNMQAATPTPNFKFYTNSDGVNFINKNYFTMIGVYPSDEANFLKDVYEIVVTKTDGKGYTTIESYSASQQTKSDLNAGLETAFFDLPLSAANEGWYYTYEFEAKDRLQFAASSYPIQLNQGTYDNLVVISDLSAPNSPTADAHVVYATSEVVVSWTTASDNPVGNDNSGVRRYRSGIKNYQIYRKLSSGWATTPIVTTTNTFAKITLAQLGLASTTATTENFVVVACDNVDNISAKESSRGLMTVYFGGTTINPPSSAKPESIDPSLPVVSYQTASSNYVRYFAQTGVFNITWTPPSPPPFPNLPNGGVKGYNIYLDDSSSPIDGSPFPATARSTKEALSTSVKGHHVYKVKTLSLANAESAPATFEFTYDTKAPDIKFITAPPQQPIRSGSAAITLNITDEMSPIKKVYGTYLQEPKIVMTKADTGTVVSCNNIAYVSINEKSLNLVYFYLLSSNLITDGVYSWEVVAKDAAGNQSVNSSVINDGFDIRGDFIVDRTGPEILSFSLVNPTNYSFSYSVRDAFTDIKTVSIEVKNAAGTRVGLENAAGTIYGKDDESTGYSIKTALGDGTYTATLICYDAAGNRSESAPIEFTVSNSLYFNWNIIGGKNGGAIYGNSASLEISSTYTLLSANVLQLSNSKGAQLNLLSPELRKYHYNNTFVIPFTDLKALGFFFEGTNSVSGTFNNGLTVFTKTKVIDYDATPPSFDGDPTITYSSINTNNEETIIINFPHLKDGMSGIYELTGRLTNEYTVGSKAGSIAVVKYDPYDAQWILGNGDGEYPSVSMIQDRSFSTDKLALQSNGGELFTNGWNCEFILTDQAGNSQSFSFPYSGGTVAAAHLDHVKIIPSIVFMGLGQTVTLEVQAFSDETEGPDTNVTNRVTSYDWTKSGNGRLSQTSGTKVIFTAPTTAGETTVTVTGAIGYATKSETVRIIYAEGQNAGELKTLVIEGNSSIRLGETASFLLFGYDSDGTQLPLTNLIFTWSSTTGKITAEANAGATYSAPPVGTVVPIGGIPTRINAQIYTVNSGTIIATKEITVLLGEPKSVSITPTGPALMVQGDKLVFYVTYYDQPGKKGNQIIREKVTFEANYLQPLIATPFPFAPAPAFPEEKVSIYVVPQTFKPVIVDLPSMLAAGQLFTPTVDISGLPQSFMTLSGTGITADKHSVKAPLTEGDYTVKAGVQLSVKSTVLPGVTAIFGNDEKFSVSASPEVSLYIRGSNTIIDKQKYISKDAVLVVKATDLNQVADLNYVIKVDGKDVTTQLSLPNASAVEPNILLTSEINLMGLNNLPSGNHQVSITITAYDMFSQMTRKTYSFTITDMVAVVGKVFVSPNPSKVKGTPVNIVFTLSAPSPVKVYIYDITGTLIWQRAVTGVADVNTVPWDANVANGTYLGLVQVGNNVSKFEAAIIR